MRKRGKGACCGKRPLFLRLMRGEGWLHELDPKWLEECVPTPWHCSVITNPRPREQEIVVEILKIR